MRVRHSDVVVLREPSVIESQLNNHDVKVIVCIMKIACCAHARAAVQLQLLVFSRCLAQKLLAFTSATGGCPPFQRPFFSRRQKPQKAAVNPSDGEGRAAIGPPQ